MISLYDTWSIVETFKIIKFKRDFKKLIMIFLYDTSSIVENFQIIKFKRNLKQVIMISVLDTSTNTLIFLYFVWGHKKMGYNNLCFGYFK
jgi:hypothetical protein